MQEAEKLNQNAVAVNNADKQDDNFEDALAELPPMNKKSLISSDSLTSNEELSTETGAASSARQTIAAKLLDGSFHVDNESKTLPASKAAEDNSTGSSNSGDMSGDIVNCNEEDITGNNDSDKATTNTTHINETNVSQISPTLTDTVKTAIPDVNKMLSNDRKLDMVTMTPHSTEIGDQTFHDAEDTTAGDDDGEFQQVMSSRKSRRFRNKKGASMEDKFYPHQNKQLDKDRGRGISSSGMRKSSSEPAGMARLGEMELEQHNENNYLRKFASKNVTNPNFNQEASEKPALVQPPTKQNIDLPSGTISYAGKVKAGIVPKFQQTAKNSNPVKFTLDDEHSDGHVSDSSVVLPQNDASPCQRTTNPSTNASIVLNKEVGANAKTPEANPKYEVPRTSPKFEISFGEFPSVNISGAPKSLKASGYGTAEGLGSRPLQKVTRSNSVDGLETDSGGNVNENPTSTTQQHQEANVQYLDLQSTNNTYAGMLKRRLPPSQAPAAAATAVPKPTLVDEPQQTFQVASEVAMLPPESVKMVVENQKLVDNKKVPLEMKYNQVKPTQMIPPQSSPHDNMKLPANSTRVENKSHQEVKAAHISGHVIASPTPSISSSKGVAASSVCFPLSMEPMDLGITFGDVNISEMLKEEPVRQDSPVDRILAGADAASLPQVPSTGHSCTDLEMAWKDESKDSVLEPHLGGAGDAAKGNQREAIVKLMSGVEPQMDVNIGSFNYQEVADMLMKGKW